MGTSKFKKLQIKDSDRKSITDPTVDGVKGCMVVFNKYNNGNLCGIESLNDGQGKKVVKLIKEISEEGQKQVQYTSCHQTKQMSAPFQGEYSFLNNYKNETILEFIMGQGERPSRLMGYFCKIQNSNYLIFNVLLITSDRHLK